MSITLRGNPTPEETAAVVVALQALAAANAAAVAAAGSRRRPGWIEAARFEALGHPPIAAPSELPSGP